MNLKQLFERRVAVHNELKALDDKAESDKRDFTDEEETRYRELNADFDGITKQIERGKSHEERERLLDGYQSEPIIDKHPATDNRAAPPAKNPERSGGFKTAGEFFRAIAAAEMPGGRVDPRLLEQRSPSGMNESVGSEGGFLVQKDFQVGLLDSAYDAGALASRVQRFPISANSNGLKMYALDETSLADGSLYGGLQAYWTGEAEQKTPTKPKFRLMDLSLHKLTGLCYVTDELLQDAVALEAFIRAAFARVFAYKIDVAILKGTGSGMPLGILNSGAVVTVTKEGSQSAATLNYLNVVNMYARFTGDKASAVWLINSDVIPQLATMSMAVGTGGVPVYLPANGAAGQIFDTLFGIPVLQHPLAETLGTTGDIMLLDLKKYLMIDKGGIEAASSVHVRFIFDETCFRFVYRADGQPLWRAPYAPAKGSNTQSPFVALQTR